MEHLVLGAVILPPLFSCLGLEAVAASQPLPDSTKDVQLIQHSSVHAKSLGWRLYFPERRGCLGLSQMEKEG